MHYFWIFFRSKSDVKTWKLVVKLAKIDWLEGVLTDSGDGIVPGAYYLVFRVVHGNPMKKKERPFQLVQDVFHQLSTGTFHSWRIWRFHVRAEKKQLHKHMRWTSKRKQRLGIWKPKSWKCRNSLLAEFPAISWSWIHKSIDCSSTHVTCPKIFTTDVAFSKTEVNHMRRVRKSPQFAWCSRKTTFSVFNCSSHTISSIRMESCKSL